jgi:arylsulfatase A-like enzyme
MRTSLAPKQRWLVRGIRAFAALLLLSVFSAPAVAANNILVLIADDFGIDSSPLYNTNPTARFPPMPNVNALAAQGVRFSNVYSYPTCSPTRSAMLTGRYGFRTGIALAINPENTVALAHSEVTLPEVLSAQTTYRHAAFGKWHLSSSNTDPNTRGGWSHFSGAIGGELPDYFSWPRVVNGTRFPNYPVYATTANVDDALTWISQQGASPWFVWIAFNAAHTPLHKPPNALHSYDSLPGTATHIASNPRPYFEAMIEALDTEIGRLLSGIDRNNTTIIFTADNGTLGQIIQPPYASSRGKGTLYEGGTRVPLIAAGAGVANPGR